MDDIINQEPSITCTSCGAEVHWLEVFPKNICLTCHDKRTAHLTPQELHNQIVSGFSIEAIDKKKGK